MQLLYGTYNGSLKGTVAAVFVKNSIGTRNIIATGIKVMKTPRTRSHFITCVLVVAISLVAISVNADQHDTQSKWTYDEEHTYFLEEWKRATHGDVTTRGIPKSVVYQFNITEETIAPEMFFSKEFQRALSESQQPYLPHVDPFEFLRRLESSTLKDPQIEYSVEVEKRKLAALSRLSNPDELPTEAIKEIEMFRDYFKIKSERRMATVHELQEQDWFSSISVDEALGMLRPEGQARLEPYREHLSDFFAIYEFARDMPDSERRAAYRLLFRMQKHKDEPFLAPELITNHARRSRYQGYSFSPYLMAPTTRIKQKIERHSDTKPSSYAALAVIKPQVFPMSSVEANAILEALSPVPEEYILPDSERFLVRDPGHEFWSRYYSRTTFGGAVLVEEMDVVSNGVFYPELLMDVRDSVIMHTKHENDHWVTKVSAFDGINKYRIVADGKLENEQKAAFIEFCTKIIEPRA